VTTLVRSDQIRIVDEKARIIMVGDRKERLAPQPFEVFRYLYLHANEVCSKEELLKGEYDEGYLHTLIGRIRKVIEEEPEHPRYLITEPNAGYRLISKPEN
jgi:two-component system KDP operon response regulator KdpE